ncbi:hypothetical protein SAMN05443580_1443 [Variovorax sp. OV084]|nr:hypothetical protein SAMN05443580_1443 [Variovorax sp. OV084]
MANQIISNIVGKGLVPKSPIYVLILLQGLEAGHQGELENSALGHYYQYLILHSLLPVVRQEAVHEVLNYCQQLAWFLNQTKPRIDEKAYRLFHAQYEEKFDLAVPLEARKRLLVGAKILTEAEGELAFRYPYSYYYFLGTYLADNLRDEEVGKRVVTYAENLHVREYGNTILFLAHHSNDDFVMELMERALGQSFAEYPEYSFEKDTKILEALAKEVKQEAVMLPPGDTKEKKFTIIEEDLNFSEGLAQISDGKLREERSQEEIAVLELVSEINGLFKGIEILGMILKARFGSLTSQKKQRLLTALVNGGLRGMRGLFETFASSPQQLLIEIEEVLTNQTPSRDRIEALAKQRVFSFMSYLAYNFVRRMGSSVSSKNLIPAITRLQTETDSGANRLVRLAALLELRGKMPMSEVINLAKEFDDLPFAFSVLARLAMRRVQLHETSDIEKQQLFAELKVGVATQRGLDFKTKNSKQTGKM